MLDWKKWDWYGGIDNGMYYRIYSGAKVYCNVQLKVAMMQTATPPTKPSTLTFTKTTVIPVMEVDSCPPRIRDGPHTVSYELAGVSAIMHRIVLY